MVWEVATAALLGSWFLLTVLKNLPERFRGPRLLQRLTASWLVPGWSFFAPVPGTKCYHLMYRDLDPHETTDWRPLAAERLGSPARFLWNPDKTGSKAMVDVANELSLIISSFSEAERHDPPPRLQMSLPYLTLLNCVAERPRLNGAVATQFVLGQTGIDDSTIIIVSSVHRLGMNLS